MRSDSIIPGGTQKSTMFNIGYRRRGFTRKNAKLKAKSPLAGGAVKSSRDCQSTDRRPPHSEIFFSCWRFQGAVATQAFQIRESSQGAMPARSLGLDIYFPPRSRGVVKSLWPSLRDRRAGSGSFPQNCGKLFRQLFSRGWSKVWDFSCGTGGQAQKKGRDIREELFFFTHRGRRRCSENSPRNSGGGGVGGRRR
jgi:hypothetical protein